MERFRVSYRKDGALRYISHLDMQKMWIRTLLRAKIPLYYTQGYHPIPKIGVSWPLALGWAGYNELIDLWLDYPENAVPGKDELKNLMNANSPEGLKIERVESIALTAKAITAAVQSADYRLLFRQPQSSEGLQAQADHLMQADKIEFTRRERSFDMRPLIESITVNPEAEENHEPALEMRMAAREGAMGRPDEAATVMGFDIFEIQFIRLKYNLV